MFVCVNYVDKKSVICAAQLLHTYAASRSSSGSIRSIQVQAVIAARHVRQSVAPRLQQCQLDTLPGALASLLLCTSGRVLRVLAIQRSGSAVTTRNCMSSSCIPCPCGAPCRTVAHCDVRDTCANTHLRHCACHALPSLAP